MPPALPSVEPHVPADGRGLRIGVFDSGLGGLSVLQAIRQRLPAADTVYVADSGHAPYGERDDAFVAGRAESITAFLLERQADVIVVACNTATAAAVHRLRERWPQLPVVGVEPGVKPAVARSRTGRVGVLATPLTLGSPKFQSLLAAHGQEAEVVLQPCPGLAREIEKGELDSPALRELVAGFAAPLRARSVDTVVLGCTHYPFVRPLFEQALGPDVAIIDTAEAVARHTARLGQLVLQARTADASGSPPQKKTSGLAELWSSADPTHLSHVANRWLGLDARASALP